MSATVHREAGIVVVIAGVLRVMVAVVNVDDAGNEC